MLLQEPNPARFADAISIRYLSFPFLENNTFFKYSQFLLLLI